MYRVVFDHGIGETLQQMANTQDDAELLANSLNISPGTYTGREADAIVAMTLIAGYRLLSPQDQTQVLTTIGEQMGFARSNPAFLQACQGAIALTVANPAWVPGSLDNEELEVEIMFWRRVQTTLVSFGATSLIPIVVGSGKSILGGMVAGKSLGSATRAAIKMPWFPIAMFASLALSVADHSLADLQREAARRGITGKMSPLHANRFSGGSQP